MKTQKNIIPSKECLEYLNHEENLTYQQISLLYDVTKQSIYKWFKKRNVKGKDNHKSTYVHSSEKIKLIADKNRKFLPSDYKGKSALIDSTMFVNSRSKLKFKCSCGEIFSRELGYAIKSHIGNVCKKCQGEHFSGLYSSDAFQKKLKETPQKERIKYRRSKDEKDLFSFVESLAKDTNYTVNHSVIINHRSVDIFIPEINLAIEYNGLSFHSEMLFYVWNNRSLEFVKNMHKEKQENVYPVRLFYVWEDDWKKKQDVVKNQLKFLILGPKRRVFARKTKVKEITSKEANNIYDNFHIQGGVNSSVSYGLFLEEELMAAVSFTKRGNEHELVRYCSVDQVIGGFSKLVSYFLKNNKTEKLYSFADLCVVNKDDNVYKNNGWISEKDLAVDYKYIVSGERRHKFGFRHDSLKNKLNNYDPTLTEYVNCVLNKVYRVWDCGKIKYSYPISQDV
jgi:hypothetical protein